MNSQAAFVTDTWSMGRVTLAYGVRWERYHNFIPPQTKEAGQFSIAQTFPEVDVLTWTDVVPRIGMNWDVTGDGKTSLKAFFGIYGDTMGGDFAATYNPNAEVTTSTDGAARAWLRRTRTFPLICPTPAATIGREASI